MKKKDVQINKTYMAKISGRVVPVRLKWESPYGGWEAVNLVTGRDVRIKTAAKLRSEVTNGNHSNEGRFSEVSRRSVCYGVQDMNEPTTLRGYK